MKINSIYISAFGGIKNLQLDLKDGLNVIYGNNENGKTTVMAFIKMMFYGSERGSSAIAKNIRKKYTPWDSSPMAGSIDFEFDGNDYRIEREFRSSNSTDKVTLCNLALGERQAVSGDIGVKFFGLSAAAFERTVFIGQFGFPESDTAAEGEINSKLSNIALTGDESISFEAVNERLSKAKNLLSSKSGRAGIYDKNLKKCAELKEQLEKAYEAQNQYNAAKERISTLENELKAMINTAGELKEKLSAEQDIRNAEKLKTLLALKAELDALNNSLLLNDSQILDEMFLRKLQFLISRFENANQKLTAKLSEKETLEKSISAGLNPAEDATEENAERLKGELSSLQEEKTKNNSHLSSLKEKMADFENSDNKNSLKSTAFLFLTIGLILLAGAAGLVILKLFIPAIISCLLSVGLIILCPVFLNVAAKKKKEKEKTLEKLNSEIKNGEKKLKNIEDEIFNKKVKLETILTSLNSNSTIIANQQKLLAEIEEQLVSLKSDTETEKSALFELFSLYKNCNTVEEIINSLDEISKKTEKQKEIKQKISFLLKDLGGISYTEAKEKLNAIASKDADFNTDFERLKETYEKLISDIGEHKTQIATLSAAASAGKSAGEKAQKLTDELKTLLTVTKEQKEYCLSLEIAMQTLLESFAEIRKSYGTVLEKTASEYFSGITDEKYQNMSISKDFDISANQADLFGSREIAYLSSGTVDQAYLSLRLALSTLICDGKEALPLLLDDALTQYDDTRLNSALKFLAEYSKNSQVIMFTCHTNISNEAEKFGSNNISLIK